MEMMTPKEVADILRIEPHFVQQWLVTGELVGFDFGGEWRVSSDQFMEFLRQTQRRTELAALKRVLQDPRTWARSVNAQPELEANILAGDFPPNSMGAFLQRAILDHTEGQPPDKAME